MLILALDTCDSRGSVAVLRDRDVLQVAAHEDSEDYSSWLLPAVDRVLSAAGLRLPEIELYSVASGPGSFTGLRVGLTSVKAWSEVYGRPIAPVSRLAALAVQSDAFSNPVPVNANSVESASLIASFIDAHRGQLFGAVYRKDAEGVERIGDEMVAAPAEFLSYAVEQAQDKRIAWVSLDPQCLTEQGVWAERRNLGESVQTISPVLAPTIGKLGFELANEGKLGDALSLDANYVRRSDAEVFWKGAVKSAISQK